jgi:phage terminase small subunit
MRTYELTPRQLAFVKNIARQGNARNQAQAARQGGYAGTSAAMMASAMVRDERIQAAINDYLTKLKDAR